MVKYETWVKKIAETVEKSKDEIEAEIQQVMESYGEFAQTKEIAALIVAKRYGIPVEVKSEDYSVFEVLESDVESANLRGMLIGVDEKPESYYVTLVEDGWAIRAILPKEFVSFKPEDFDFVELMDVYIGRKSEPPIAVLRKTGIAQKIKSFKTPEEITVSYSDDVEDGRVVHFKGVVTNVEEYPYKGCPMCLKKAEDKCEKCGVKSITLVWKSISITNGKTTLELRLSPTQSYPAPPGELLGNPVIAFGILDKENLRLTNGSLVVVSVSKAESTAPEKPQEKKPKEEPKEKTEGIDSEKIKETLMNYLELYGSLPVDAPNKLLKAKLNVEEEDVINVVDELEEEGKITIKDGRIYPLK